MNKNDFQADISLPASSEKFNDPAATWPKRETIVFAFDTDDQRAVLMKLIDGMWKVESGLRVVAMSADNEMTRVDYFMQAVERYDDHYDLREALQAIWDCPDLSKWDWEAFENGDDAELNFSDEPERTGVSLNQTSLLDSKV